MDRFNTLSVKQAKQLNDYNNDRDHGNDSDHDNDRKNESEQENAICESGPFVFEIKKTNVPPKFLNKFINLLEELEKEMNTMYRISIQEIGCGTDVVLKPFEDRTRYIVEQMDSQYKDLEGEYKTVDGIYTKIHELKYKNLLNSPLTWKKSDYGGYCEGTWKCPKCNKNDNPVAFECCQRGCHYTVESIWQDIIIDVKNQSIYVRNGGSISICHPIGKVFAK
jgi:hypothetical protein